MVETTRLRSRQLGFAFARGPWQGLHAERKLQSFVKVGKTKPRRRQMKSAKNVRFCQVGSGAGRRAGCGFVGMTQCCSLTVRGDFVELARHGTGPSTSSGRTVRSGHRWGGLNWRGWPAAFLLENL